MDSNEGAAPRAEDSPPCTAADAARWSDARDSGALCFGAAEGVQEGSAWRLDFASASAGTSLTVHLQGTEVLRLDLAHAGRRYHCADAECIGAAAALDARNTALTITLEGVSLLGGDGARLDLDARLQGRLPERTAQLCPGGEGLSWSYSDGHEQAFCPQGGRGLGALQDGSLAYLFRALDGRALALRRSDEGVVKGMETADAAFACAPCSGLWISTEAGGDRLSFAGVQLAGRGEAADQSLLLNGSLSLPRED